MLYMCNLCMGDGARTLSSSKVLLLGTLRNNRYSDIEDHKPEFPDMIFIL